MKEAHDNKPNLSRKHIGLVQDAVGELMKDAGVFAETVKDSESKLKGLLKKAGANDDDIKAIMNYFEHVQNNLDDESHLGCW